MKKDTVKISNKLASRHHRVSLVETYDSSVTNMFKSRGYQIERNMPNPDLLVFTGGADINPALYGQKNIASGPINALRDDAEVTAFQKYRGVPMVGICRGAQLLNVLSGGNMFQDVNNHVGSSHECVDLLKLFPRELSLNSCHHQMMVPDGRGDLISYTKKATYFKADPMHTLPRPEVDAEVVYYEHTKSLCFQAHPEWLGKDSDCQVYFFELINYLL